MKTKCAIHIRRLLPGRLLSRTFLALALAASGAAQEAKTPAPTATAPATEENFGAPPAAAPVEDFGAPMPANPGAAAESFGGESFGGPITGAGPASVTPAPPQEAAPVIKYANAQEAHIRFLDLLESEKRFPTASACAECHPDHYREWSVSAHAYAQLSPVFNTMHAAILKRTAGTNGDFCIRCHTQIGMQREEPLFTSNLKRHPASIEGITCIVCHRVDRNYGKVSGRTAIVEGSVFEPVFGPKGGEILKQTIASNPNLKPSEEAQGQQKIHKDALKFDPITTSAFCGSCHDVNLLNGFRLEEAFTQFKNSPAAKNNTNCQDCHMGKVPGAKVAEGEKNYAKAPAARIGGAPWAVEGDPDFGTPTPPRKRTNHMFVGPDYSIIHPGIFPHSKQVRDLLWDMQKQDVQPNGDIEVKERASLKHVITFKWEDGWGDAESAFEKRVRDNPKIEEGLPWPWSDRQYRMDFRLLLNTQFRNLNAINAERQQILRRGIQLGQVMVTRDDKKGLDFKVQVRNGTDGHGVPTGFDAERLMVLQVTVTDAKGRVLYQSGDRDPNGDVRDIHSTFVHHNAPKTGHWLNVSSWKNLLGRPLLPEDRNWRVDGDLLNLQSKFLVRNLRGGEREQVLAVNQVIDPLPYIRPDTRPGILFARPTGARKQAGVLLPNESRWGTYEVPASALTGDRPYKVNLKFVCQMVPVNLIKEIAFVGFDYDLSPMEVAKRVAFGHRVSPSTRDSDRRGGALTIWDKTFTVDGRRTQWDFTPSEKEILAQASTPFPYDSKFEEKQLSSAGGIMILPLPVEEPKLPMQELPAVKPLPLVPPATEDFGQPPPKAGDAPPKEEGSL
ncbi:MAG: multiheme c-type cytochrome [Prosthecobacter sp.]